MINPSRTECGLPSSTDAIHERARVALVGVDDDVTNVAVGVATGFPFEARRKTSAASSAQTGLPNFRDNLLGRHLKEHFGKR